MVTRKEALLELERRGALPPRQQAALDELRARGAIGTLKDLEKENVRRELRMSADEFQEYQKTRKAAGLPIRGQATDARLWSDIGTDQLLLQDEIVGAGEFVKQLATGDRSIIDPKAWSEAGDAYSRGADRVRAEREVANEEFGYGALIPQIIGGLGMVAKPGGLKTAPGAAAAAAKAQPQQTGNAMARWLKGAGKSAKVGAAYGGALGFTGGEDGIPQRIGGAVGGALTGAAVAPAISHVVAPGAVLALRKAIEASEPARRAVASRFSANPDAILLRTLERQGQTPAQAQAFLDEGHDLARYGTRQTELPEMIVDTGRATRRLSRAVEAQPGAGSTLADEVLTLRQRGSSPDIPKTVSNPNYVPKTIRKQPNPAYDPKLHAGQRREIRNPDYQESQHGRINDQFRRGLGVSRDSYHKTKDRLVQDQKDDAGKIYKEFHDLTDGAGEPLKVDVGPILARSEANDVNLTPYYKNLMRKARAEFMDEDIVRDVGRDANNQVMLGKDAVMGRTPNYKLGAARFDSAKQRLDDMIDDAVAYGRNGEVRILTELKNELLARADKVFIKAVRDASGKPKLDGNGKAIYRPVYAEARDAFERPAKMLDAMARGRTFMKGDTEVTLGEYKALSTGERRMFRIGMAQQAKVDVGGKQKGADAVRYFDRDNVQQILSDVMTRKEYLRLHKLHEREAGMIQSNRMKEGSPTSRIDEEKEDLNFMAKQTQDAQQAGSMFGYVMIQANKAVQRLTRMRENDAAELARMLYERDRGKQRVILERLERKYGRPRVQRGMAAAIREIQREQRRRLQNQGLNEALPRIGGMEAGGEAAIHRDANRRQ